MNADDLKKLPRYITGRLAEMWGPLPEGFTIDNEDAVFVRLRDVEALVCNIVVKQPPAFQGFVSVGFGGPELASNARLRGLNLYILSNGFPQGGCYGNLTETEYFIKKEAPDA